MTGHARIVRRSIAGLLLAGATVVSAACGSPNRAGSGSTPPAGQKSAPTRGGSIVGSVRADPASFNRLVAADRTSELVSVLTQAKLVRVNKTTQQVEPWLAESWTADRDGRRYTLTLRRGVTFSDGVPFTSDDVVFTFAAVYDAKVDSVLADAMTVAGRPMEVVALDPQTVSIAFAAPFGPGVRILDNLPILPKHKLEPALQAGTFAKAWTTSTPPADLAGLGPFVLHEYMPGQRMVFDRNPHYWRTTTDGAALPYLDRLTVELIPDQNAEMLRLDAGQLDVMNEDLTPDAYGQMKQAARDGRIQLVDIGTAIQADSFWFNLKPGAFDGDPRAGWLQRDELRHAISMAVDRKAFIDAVFLGAAEAVYGPTSPSNKDWYWTGTPTVPYDPARAKALLASIGVPPGARFSVLVQRGRPRFERGAAFIRDELKKVGLTVDVVALEGNAVVQRLLKARYDAAYFAPTITDTDPVNQQDFFMSAGPFHLWNMAQAKPATDWERHIDELMQRQSASTDAAERKRLFDEVQRTFVEHEPVIYFAARHLYVAVSSRIAAMKPADDLFPVLWAPDEIAVRR
ncbi:MAG TPA: ABC transporter substrate-binding protein [Vicinamibacterales bacterium]|nr:ABC transporter substrate-binding protein [Vicinamibacterales bacterium]